MTVAAPDYPVKRIRKDQPSKRRTRTRNRLIVGLADREVLLQLAAALPEHECVILDTFAVKPSPGNDEAAPGVVSIRELAPLLPSLEKRRSNAGPVGVESYQ